ncbi:prepilin peptidase [Streptomyces sp. CA-294286]|uniref:prepilin peptidase n=1 Tax=Streptomyces sp. CA-294286 TaxID=3240070 RepID=UPI003D8EA750
MSVTVALTSAAVLWGAAAGLLVPRAAHRLSVEPDEPWRAACPAGHPFTGPAGGWVGTVRCVDCAGATRVAAGRGRTSPDPVPPGHRKGPRPPDAAPGPLPPTGRPGPRPPVGPPEVPAGAVPPDAPHGIRNGSLPPGPRTGFVAPDAAPPGSVPPGALPGSVPRAAPPGAVPPHASHGSLPSDAPLGPRPPAAPYRPPYGKTLRFVLLGGVLCGALAFATGPRPELAVWLLLVPFAVLLAVVDRRVHRLPDVLTLPLAGAATGLLGLAELLPGDDGSWFGALLGGAGLGATYFVLFLINPAGMGFGDVKLALGIGTVLGWYGWSVLFVGAMAGFVLGALYGLGLILMRRGGRRTAIPFGPFMLAGAWAGLLLGGLAAAG